jgi:hypothetical protein
VAPGHGPWIDDPAAKIEEYLTHRLAREQAIAAALREARRATIEDLVKAVYVDVPDALHPIARFSVWAHLRKLADEGRASAADRDDIDAPWETISA